MPVMKTFPRSAFFSDDVLWAIASIAQLGEEGVGCCRRRRRRRNLVQEEEGTGASPKKKKKKQQSIA